MNSMIVLPSFREDHSKKEPLWRTCDSVGEKSVAHILELNSKKSGSGNLALLANLLLWLKLQVWCATAILAELVLVVVKVG